MPNPTGPSPGSATTTACLQRADARQHRASANIWRRTGSFPNWWCAQPRRGRARPGSWSPRRSPAAPTLVHDERIYQNRPDILLDVIHETEADIHVLLLVGHNPSFQGLAELLSATGDIESRQRLREKFPTTGLAVIDFAVDAWERVHAQSGRLDRMITPRLLDAAPD